MAERSRARALALVALLVVLFLLAMVAAALAAPPPKDSEDWRTMAPFADWVTTQHDTLGRWCCDIGDGRPVEARIANDHWEAHVTPQHFPDTVEVCGGPVVGPGSLPCQRMTPDGVWVAIPDEKITRNANPTGTPILWLYQGRVQCFAPPAGV